MKKIFLISSLLVLGACAGMSEGIDFYKSTSFEPFSDGSFKYVGLSNLLYPLDDEGETYRIAWLEKHLKMNDLCADGYEITERKTANFAPHAYRVYYTGHCV